MIIPPIRRSARVVLFTARLLSEAKTLGEPAPEPSGEAACGMR